jgi:hypothetical protein
MMFLSGFFFFPQVQHQLLLHRDKTVSWITLDKDENNFARAVEYHLTFDLAGENRKEKDTPPSSNVVVWLCAHCLDLQSQLDPQELHVTIEHLKAVYVCSDSFYIPITDNGDVVFFIKPSSHISNA